MHRQVGLWIDHRKAVVVTLTDGDEELGLVASNVERQARRSPLSRHDGSFEPQQVPADDSRQRASTGHLKLYYDEIIAGLRGSEAVLIFGPGEAKDELANRLKRTDRGGCVVSVETADRMTDHQIAAKVRKHFAGTHPLPA